MTKRELQRLVTDWRDRLGFGYWEITLDLANPPDESDGVTAFAQIDGHDDYDTATIRLAKNWAEWTPLFAEQTIVHELMHLHMGGLDYVMAKFVRDYLRPNEREIFDAAYSHEMEGAVDRLASRFVTLLGEK